MDECYNCYPRGFSHGHPLERGDMALLLDFRFHGNDKEDAKMTRRRRDNKNKSETHCKK